MRWPSSASLLPGLDAVRLSPGALVDFESLATPVLGFSLRFRFADGSVWDDPVTRHVTVLDTDDTAPTGLAFASGGTVVAGAIGAAIGRLAVTDPDTLAGFRFSFGPDDDWRFEVVDGVLKLRDGISLGLDDMPQRPLIIEVSDGHQSAAFLLWLGVADPNTGLVDLPAGRDARRLRPGRCRNGAGAAREPRRGAGRCARGRGAAADPAGRHASWCCPRRSGCGSADGFQDIGAGSPGVRAAALVQALTGHAADGRALAGLVARAEAGVAWTDLAAGLPGLAGGTMRMRSPRCYHNALGRDPSGAELAPQLGRLAAGVSRAQLAVDVALGADRSATSRRAGSGWRMRWAATAPGGPGPAGCPARPRRWRRRRTWSGCCSGAARQHPVTAGRRGSGPGRP